MTQYPNIGLMGRKRSGKSAVAEILHRLYGYEIIGFADPLRDMAAAINPIIEAEGNAPFEPVFYRYNDVVAEHGYDLAKELYPEVRRFLQVLGTEAVREVLGNDTWIKHLRDRADVLTAEGKHFAVIDVRFPNEYDEIAWRGDMVRVERPGLLADPADAHVSERALDDYAPDFTIENDGDLHDLESTVARTVRALQFAA